MTNFTKEDMMYECFYTWKRDGEDELYTGHKDVLTLDRDKGYEVLDFANTYLYCNTFVSGAGDLHKLEKLLREKLPLNIIIKADITKFLIDNW